MTFRPTWSGSAWSTSISTVSLDPKVEEYDTLTSEDKWGQTADVILANPPFMSPKGGIRPHNRFQVQSKRSEVLFVDYMAEHLNPNGRAAIVVPEGIIFQSQSAYCELRRMLVEGKYLAAVISLPAGVFNPYSGVKTSILILDRAAAKASDSIAFFKIENDGFGLGAQRRAVKGSQLGQVKAELAAWLDAARGGGADVLDSSLGFAVEKARLGEDGQYNLSGERYREATRIEYAVPRVPISEVCVINPRKSEIGGLPPETIVSFAPMAVLNEHRISFHPDETKSLSEVGASYTYFADGDVLLAKVTPCFENGKAGIARDLTNGVGFGSSEFYVLRPGEQALAQWVYHCVMHPSFRAPATVNMTGTGGLQRVPRDFVERFEIPLPPLEVQREIVAEIEGYQKVIDGARAVLENYRPHIPIDPAWPVETMGDLCVSISDGDHQPPPKSDEGVPFITISNLDETAGVNFDKTFFVPQNYYEALKDHRKPKIGDILYSVTGSYGVVVPVTTEHPFCFQRHIALFRPSEKVLSNYLLAILRSPFGKQQGDAAATGVAQKTVSLTSLREFKIPLPSLETQQAIVAEIETEQALVAANRELIIRFEAKIEQAIARVWGGAEGPASGEVPA